MSEHVVLAQVALPPSQENCFAGLCAQTACCDLLIRVAGADADADDDADAEEEEVYVLSVCDAHALNAMPAVFAEARRHFPGEQVDVPPWERTDDKPEDTDGIDS